MLNSMSPRSLHSVITTQIYGTRFTAHVLCLTVHKSISQALPHLISSRLPWAFLVLRSLWLGGGQSKSCSGFSIKPVLWYLSHFFSATSFFSLTLCPQQCISVTHPRALYLQKRVQAAKENQEITRASTVLNSLLQRKTAEVYHRDSLRH